MTPAQYARVKEVFAAATEQPDQERAAFVREQFVDSPDLIDEVLSLLGHHDDKTILDEAATTTTAPVSTTAVRPDLPNTRRESTPGRIEVLPREPADTLVVNREIWEESRQLLRRRLSVIATIMALLIAVSMVRLLTYHQPPSVLAAESQPS